MKDLNTLGLEPIDHDPVTESDITSFEKHFGVSLPASYVDFLRHMNGATCELEFTIGDEPHRGGSVGLFYGLGPDHDDMNDVWYNTAHFREMLGDKSVMIGEDGGGGQVYLDMSDAPPSVHMLYPSSNMLRTRVAHSFEEFIDSLEPLDEDDPV